MASQPAPPNNIDTPQKTPSSDASNPQQSSSRSMHRSQSIRAANMGASDKKARSKPHQNVRIAHSTQAIFDNFRGKTAIDPKTNKEYEILLGKHSVIGPNVVISAEKGNIKIGDDNIISEGTVIVNKDPEGRDMIIGNGNFFECNARIEAFSIGNYNVFGAKSHIMSGAEIHNGCVIGPRVMVIQNKIIPDCMIIFGENMMHEQKLMLKRNRSYMDQMVPVMLKRFAEKEPSNNPPSKPSGSSSSSNANVPPKKILPSSSLSSSQQNKGANALPNQSKARDEKQLEPIIKNIETK